MRRRAGSTPLDAPVRPERARPGERRDRARRDRALFPAAPAAVSSGSGFPPRLLPWLPLLLAILVYLPTLRYGFVWDDVDFIAANPAAQNLSSLPQSLRHGYGWVPGGPVEPDALIYYRPVITAANALTWAVSGGRPWLFHLENVLAHGGAAALLALLAASLGLSAAGALAAGVLFALHPVLSEPVAWISGRTDVFAGFFALWALLMLVRWRRADSGASGSTGPAATGRDQPSGTTTGSRPSARRTHLPRLSLSYATLAIFLALGSKESAIALLVPAAFVLAAPRARATRPRRAWIALAAPVLLYGIIRVAVLGLGHAPAAGPGSASRLLLSGNLLLAYIRQIAIPWPLVTEPPASLAQGGAPVLAGLAGLMLLGALGACWLWTMRRGHGALLPAVSVGLGLFLGALLPVLQWVRTGEIYGERFLYLPLAGLLLALAALADPLLRRRPAAAWTAIAVLGLPWLVLLERRLPDWRDNLTLYASAARVRPESARALANYGSALAAGGRPEEGRPLLERAVRLAPHDPLRRQQYGTLLLNTGRFAEASAELEQAYRGGLRSPALIKNLGVALTRTDRYGEAVALLQGAMQTDPSDPELPDALGTARRRLGQTDEAAALFRRSIALAPARPGPWVNLIAMLAYESGDRTEAAATGQEFLRRFPNGAEAEIVRHIVSELSGPPPPMPPEW